MFHLLLLNMFVFTLQNGYTAKQTPQYTNLRRKGTENIS